MSPFNFLEQAFNQLLVNPRSSPQEKEDLFDLKTEFEKQYGSRNYFLVPSSGSAKSENESVKLIALHHEAVMNSAKRVNSHFNLNASMTWGCVIPWFHVGGLGVYARAFAARATVHQHVWDADFFCAWITMNHIQLVSLVPAQIYDLVQRKAAVPKIIKFVFIGGARLDTELRKKIKALGWPIIESYGMTETASMVAVGEPENMRLLPDVDIGLTDGKLKIKCDSLLTCSLQKINQKINQKIEIKPVSGAWYQTEDLAEVSNQGQNVVLKLIGRTNDFIKINAEGVSLVYLRQILGLDPGLVLLALPNERSEFEIVLVYEKNVQHVEKIIKNYNLVVKPYEKIQKTYCVQKIPYTELQKVQYKKLEEMLKEVPYEKI